MVVCIQRGNSLFCRVARLARDRGAISIAEVQREFSPGYAEAGKVVESLKKAGIVGDYRADHRRPYLGGVVA